MEVQADSTRHRVKGRRKISCNSFLTWEARKVEEEEGEKEEEKQQEEEEDFKLFERRGKPYECDGFMPYL